MKLEFGKCENEVIKCWSQTLFSSFPSTPRKILVFSTCTQKLSSQFFDLDIENTLIRGTFVKIKSPMYWNSGPIRIWRWSKPQTIITRQNRAQLRQPNDDLSFSASLNAVSSIKFAFKSIFFFNLKLT